jgi:hypothetical protein
MKLKFFIFLFLPLFCHAQTQRTIISELAKQDYSGGTVVIDSDPKITALIGKPLADMNAPEISVKMPGFRIQAFSGNQQNSRAEAEAKAKQIRSLFPDISTDVTYRAPIWRLRVGDFQTNEEASNFMKKFKKEYPTLGREMNIVPDEIKVVF